MEKNKKCHHLLASLSDYVDGTLDDNLCTELERHLTECDDCRIVVDTMKKTIYLYRNSSEPVEVPADVRQRLFERLDLGEYIK